MVNVLLPLEFPEPAVSGGWGLESNSRAGDCHESNLVRTPCHMLCLLTQSAPTGRCSLGARHAADLGPGCSGCTSGESAQDGNANLCCICLDAPRQVAAVSWKAASSAACRAGMPAAF